MKPNNFKEKLKIDTKFLLEAPLLKLIQRANQVREQFIGKNFELCGIVNAKSGHCSEDCKFCAQSSHHKSEISVYPLIAKEEIIDAARAAKTNGAKKFGIVTSGNRLDQKELVTIAEAITEIKNIGIEPCASLGALSKAELTQLKDAGLTRYHHNIETSPRYYSQIASTHNFEERVNTVKAAKEVGLSVCSGGIVGMGETWQDRIDMATTLKELDVDSVPINILVPIKGTALESLPPLSGSDALRTICIFRIILQDKTIKIAAGRETTLKDFQAMGFMAGANGMLIGGYLTVKGRTVAEDHKLIEEVTKLWNG
ncbi:MAG: biotin synthase BioB [Candidatus Margulisbacteria bacterium]|nr:biotin synthase BioB [Candidatus Margulisiibacteriota bacterium]MBU1021203.1 biotin synthase BioB [Candidatus Margulisiibacteriota bacterium]MBU1729809.1 biotin synthase BioB [Candidatus Margulisiibacteriota bacterium]MBU1955310.1 biotin synthase BioB [Candidatus Margulisiibacteriota bacterium]